MGSLGELLTLLHDTSGRALPARLTVVEWRHGTRSSDAFARFIRERHGSSLGSIALGSDTDAPDEATWTTRLTYESPDRFREESAGVQEGKRYLVRDGSRWLTWDDDWGVVSSDSEPEGAPPAPSFAFLLDPLSLVTAYRLDPVGTGAIAGRPTISVEATPRVGGEAHGSAVFRVGPGADRLDLAFDAERGILLRSEAFLRGEPFHRLEVVSVDFDRVARVTFDVSPPPGEARSAARWARPLPVALHELAARCPFTVLAPTRVPAGWRLLSSLFPAPRERPPVEAAVFLTYASVDGVHGISLEQRQGTGRDTEASVTDAGAHADPRFTVLVERRGTRVSLAGNARELLVELAGVLEPAPTEPPRLA